MEPLTQSLLDAVTANLPQMVGEQLRKRLEQADRDAIEAAKVPTLKASLEQAAKRIDEYAREHENVKKLAADLEDQRRQHELAKARLEAREKSAEDRVAFARETLQTVFRDRNTMLSFAVNGSIPVPVQGGYHTMQPVDLKGTVYKD